MKQRFKYKKMKLLKENEIVFKVVLRQKAPLCFQTSFIHALKEKSYKRNKLIVIICSVF